VEVLRREEIKKVAGRRRERNRGKCGETAESVEIL